MIRTPLCWVNYIVARGLAFLGFRFPHFPGSHTGGSADASGRVSVTAFEKNE